MYRNESRSCNDRAKEELAMIEALKPVGKSLETEKTDLIYVSVHARNFSWPDNRGAACNISIFHSWHPCS